MSACSKDWPSSYTHNDEGKAVLKGRGWWYVVEGFVLLHVILQDKSKKDSDNYGNDDGPLISKVSPLISKRQTSPIPTQLDLRNSMEDCAAYIRHESRRLRRVDRVLRLGNKLYILFPGDAYRPPRPPWARGLLPGRKSLDFRIYCPPGRRPGFHGGPGGPAVPAPKRV